MRDAAPRDATVSRASDRLPAPRKAWRRNNRLLHRPEYDAVYREGRRRAFSFFVVFYRPNGLRESRFGMSVRKAVGAAVERNRIRRRIREILRQNREEIASGWDIVIQPRGPAAKAPFSQLSTELLRLLCQISSPPTAR